MMRLLTLLLSAQIALGPSALGAPASAPANAPAGVSASDGGGTAVEGKAVDDRTSETVSGWRNVVRGGIWWHSYEVDLSGSTVRQPGLVSFNMGLTGDYHFDPIYLGYDFDFMSPQIFWKSVGLGIFYFFCFFLTAGKCSVNASFATGERDAGFLGVGAHFGYRFKPVPIRVFAGPDLGLFHSGLTSYPFSTVFVKGGVAADLSDRFGIEVAVRRSVWMAQWDLGAFTNVSNPNVWMVSLSLLVTR